MIGIFGGTFDPVHYGHLKTVCHVQQQLKLETIKLIPLGHAVHRNQPVASPAQRLAMLQAAVKDIPGLEVDDREIQRGGGSYTYDTLESLQQQSPAESFCLITGTDAFNGFTGWFKPGGILKLAHIIVMQRPDAQISDDDQLQQILAHHLSDNAADLHKQPAGRIVYLQVPQLDISSTMVRRKLHNAEAVDDLLPGAVAEKIQQWHLYQ